MTALILVDLQNDFMSGGALPVPHGDRTVPVANYLIRAFQLVVATQDWHPAEHSSFASCHPGVEPGEVVNLNGLRQEVWPDHCIQGTPGAELHSALDQDKITRVFRKGSDPAVDSYSAFFDSTRQKSTGLDHFLCQRDINEIYLMGLATEYCVKYSALDAISLGFTTYVIEDGCCGIGLQTGDTKHAFEIMATQGVRIISSKEVMNRLRMLEASGQ